MTAAPKDLDFLDIEQEKQRLEQALEELRLSNKVKLTWLKGHTAYDLQNAMRRGLWHIFHFIGHGGFSPNTGEGLIALEDDDGFADHFGATNLARLLHDHRFLRLVVLNSCEGARGNQQDLFSSTAATLIRRGIPAVLAMQYDITDRAAVELSRVFYEALAESIPVDRALGEARKAISYRIPNTLEWGTPVLYMRSPDGVLFAVKPQMDAEIQARKAEKERARKAKEQEQLRLAEEERARKAQEEEERTRKAKEAEQLRFAEEEWVRKAKAAELRVRQAKEAEQLRFAEEERVRKTREAEQLRLAEEEHTRKANEKQFRLPVEERAPGVSEVYAHTPTDARRARPRPVAPQLPPTTPDSKRVLLYVSTMGQIDHGKTTLTAAITRVLNKENKANNYVTFDQIDNAPESVILAYLSPPPRLSIKAAGVCIFIQIVQAMQTM